MMPNAAERQARALEGINRYMKDLVEVMTVINQNLVEFTKYLKESDEAYDEKFAGKGDMCVMTPREGLNYEELERRSAELLRNNPVSHQIPPDGGE